MSVLGFEGIRAVVNVNFRGGIWVFSVHGVLRVAGHYGAIPQTLKLQTLILNPIP